MLIGIAVIGVVTASVAAWLVRQDQQPGQARERSEIRALHEEIHALREQVELLVARDQAQL